MNKNAFKCEENQCTISPRTKRKKKTHHILHQYALRYSWLREESDHWPFAMLLFSHQVVVVPLPDFSQKPGLLCAYKQIRTGSRSGKLHKITWRKQERRWKTRAGEKQASQRFNAPHTWDTNHLKIADSTGMSPSSPQPLPPSGTLVMQAFISYPPSPSVLSSRYHLPSASPHPPCHPLPSSLSLWERL